MRIAVSALLVLVLPGQAMALPLDLPRNAELARENVTPLGSYALPTAPFADGYRPSIMTEGEVTAQAWQIEAASLTTLQLLSPLRDQLIADGFAILFVCDTEDCGGFDFRAAITVLPPPEMHVDLGDFRFLSAQRGDEALSLLISRTRDAGYVQMIRVGPPLTDEALTTSDGAPIRSNAEPDPGDAATPMPLPTDFGGALEADGHVVLSDLDFATGSAQLAEGTFASLQDLADYLTDNPTRRVALVGHTDSQGSLDGNIALSKRRAGSVLERLVSDYDIPRQQLEAEGMGYLSPIASNLTEAGRQANRRVEVIIISTE